MRYFILSLGILILLAGSQAYSTEEFKIEYDRNPAYLPLKFDTITRVIYPSRKQIQCYAYVLETGQGESNKAKLVTCRNGKIGTNDPAVIGFRSYPPLDELYDNSFRLELCFVMLHREKNGDPVLIGTGFRGDSAYIVRINTAKGNRAIIPISSRSSLDNSDKWEPNVGISAIEDYDFDGRTEAFIMVKSDKSPANIHNELICIEIDDLRVEWRLAMPVFTDVIQPYKRKFGICSDSLNPRVMFVTYGSRKRKYDSNFHDYYKNLCVVDDQGKIVYNRLVSAQIDFPQLLTLPSGNKFLLGHTLNLLDPNSLGNLNDSMLIKSLKRDSYHLSIIDKQAEILKTTTLDEEPINIWLSTFKKRDDTCIYIKFKSNNIRVYDLNLNEIARSRITRGSGYVDHIKLQRYGDCAVFGNGIYSKDYKKLAHFPSTIMQIEPLMIDSNGLANEILINTLKGFYICRLKETSLFEMISYIYINNQTYVLMALSGLLLLLVVVNFYRHKNRANLIRIARQKRELEETHQALRRAQQTIIEQEKYKQARDIAGGFAHEIRNALFPAKSMIRKFSKDRDSRIKDEIWLNRFIESANLSIERAIELTRLISQYTSLESLPPPVPVNIMAVIKDMLSINQTRIEDQAVSIRVECNPNLEIPGNHENLLLVFNNILSNSLDALTKSVSPHIFITARDINNSILIEFEDNGSGISPEDLGKIFDFFFSTKPDKGTGIGLTITKKIVEFYGGTIEANSDPGSGTTIKLLFNQS